MSGEHKRINEESEDEPDPRRQRTGIAQITIVDFLGDEDLFGDSSEPRELHGDPSLSEIMAANAASALNNRFTLPDRALSESRYGTAAPLPWDDDTARVISNIANNTVAKELGIPIADCKSSGMSSEEAKPVILCCITCRVNQIQTVNFPCMHACFCLDCAKETAQYSEKCPFCKEYYMHISMLYVMSEPYEEKSKVCEKCKE